MAIKRKSFSTIPDAEGYLASVAVIRETDGRGPIRRLYETAPTTQAAVFLISKGFTEEEIGKKYGITQSAFRDYHSAMARKDAINKKRDAKHGSKPVVTEQKITNAQLDEILEYLDEVRRMVIELKHGDS